ESDWVQSLGRWKLDAKGLYPASRKGKGAVLLSQRRYLGDVRIEIQGQTIGAGAETGELSVLLCMPEPEPGVNETDGYCLQVGADWNTSAKICKNDVDLTVRSDVELLYGQTHAVAGQRVGNRMALEFNGDELLSFDDLVPLNGHRVGVYGWGSGCRITAIRIFQRGLDAVVSCMAVPDHDFNRGRFAEAFAGYARIAEELAGREEGWMARFKAGLSRLEADDPNGAEAEYAKLDGTPGEVLAHLGRAMISAREGDHRREMMRLGAARRTGAGTAMQGYVLARLWLRAEELFEANQFEPAIAYFSEAVEADAEGGKRRVRALAAIAQAQLQMNQFDEAVRTVERVEREKKAYPDILRSLYGALVHDHMARAQWDRALERCASFERFPEIAYHAWVNRAEIERLRGHWARAAEHLAEAAKLAAVPAQKAVVRHQSALVDMEAGRLDEALKTLEELSAFKGTVDLQAQQDARVYLLAMRGQGTKALAVLATRLRSEDHKHRMILLAQLGKLLRLRGEHARGRECFLQALAQLRRYARQSAQDVELELGLACLGLNERVPATEAFNRVMAARTPSLARLLVQAFRAWQNGEPMPEPPEPSRECPWARRGEYFFCLGEYALANGRREDAVRGYRRALIETPSGYRTAAWLSAVRLKELGETLPKNTPDFPPIVRRRSSGAAAELLGD
ncbi:MAG: tetratricopeptide repeat protein, partial [Planctomycetota bacterium]|nr:tetratricopeptide repeat protein [Planctomycetota bacterium]